MRRLWLPVLLVAVVLLYLLPSVSYTEDQETILLARTLYALARDESYETKLALGSVVMNRVDSVWFEDSVEGVLREQMQFPQSDRYDDDSLRAAHEVISGTRVIAGNALYYQASDAREPYSAENRLGRVGGYVFYSDDGRL
ncbi:MAG: cell wall hydrolase [Clostridiales bacterium]|nr:cell wall hydrolase [Clostridiales bacterium]